MAQQGIRTNLHQFLLLVLANLFVGAMVGQERSILPLLAREEFGIASRTAALSFLVSFGTTKALGNLFAGRLADRFGRRRVLLLGWLFGLPVPLVLILADQWLWIILANILLGINQALCWSATVIMKLDLAGPRRGGLATAANEWAGYVGVAVAAWATGFLAAGYGLRPVPFYLGLGLAAAGLLVSWLLIRPTAPFTEQEAKSWTGLPDNGSHRAPSLGAIVLKTMWTDRSLLAASQAGRCTNLKDGLIWGLIPIYLEGAGLSYGRIGIITALYPAVWGFCQLVTGPVSDRIGRKWLIAAGMEIQGAGVLLLLGGSFGVWLAAAATAGLGTALVYPVLLAAVSDIAPPRARGSFLGGYRFWRDGGYALAGLGIGPVTDAFGAAAAITAVAVLAILSALTVAALMAPRLRLSNCTDSRENSNPLSVHGCRRCEKIPG